MKKLGLSVLMVLVLAMVAGAFAVKAAPITPTPVPIKPAFTDGRLNAYDPGAPVAIFETRQSVPVINSNGVPTTGEIVCGVQLLFWNGSSAQQVLFASTDQIRAAVNKVGGNNGNNSSNT